MNIPVILGRSAQVEFYEAADWYEQRRVGRGAAFTTAVRHTLERIASSPESYAEVHGSIREAPVSGYPYAVYYRVGPQQISVLAIFHTSRDPTVWQSRSSQSPHDSADA